MFASENSGPHKHLVHDLLCLCYISPSLEELYRAAAIFGRRDVDVYSSFTKYGGSMRHLFNSDDLQSRQYLEYSCAEVSAKNISHVATLVEKSNIAHLDSLPTSLFSTFLKPGALACLQQDEHGEDMMPWDEADMDALTDAYLPNNVLWRIATDEISKKIGLFDFQRRESL